ncbi:MAG: LD-carboxypeptidase [Ferruginibacter sp.]|nr:LD-carboxypeptidase [Ferruginibacter sp.]
MITPPYLKKGDTIAITCPAGFMLKERVKTCVDTLKKQGYKVIVGKTVGGKSKTYFSGTDNERMVELQSFLDNKNIKAILCGRGGYGTGRIIDKLNFTKLIQHPKWVIGFSDITILHSHIVSNYNIATLHAPMAAAFANDAHNPENVITLLNALKGEKSNYKIKPYTLNKLGEAKGKLIGGNLALLANAIGTVSGINTKNAILFIEDIGEQLYAVDRMMYQLKRTGKLKNLAALIVGDFTDIQNTDKPFGKTIYEIINDIVAEYNYPVCYNFPVGHGNENRALKVGVRYTLTVNKSGVELIEN